MREIKCDTCIVKNTMSEIHSHLEEWSKTNGERFSRHSITTSKISVSTGGRLWVPANIEGHDDKPGIAFFKAPPTIISRNFAYPKPATNSKGPARYDLYNYDHEAEFNDVPQKIEDILEVSPPIVSEFPNLVVTPIQDERIDIGILKPGPLSYYTITFDNTIKSSVGIIEPIIVNVFLWDCEKKCKMSETWRFLSQVHDGDKNIEKLVGSEIADASTTVMIPYTTNHKMLNVIVSLDRLLVRDGGSSLQKYYEKPTQANADVAKADIAKCVHEKTSTTFCYARESIQNLIPSGDPQKYTFKGFIPTQTVNDAFLAAQFAQGTKQQVKTLPFEITFEVSSSQSNTIPKLRHYFKFSPYPFTTFVNELIVFPMSAKFKFPRGQRGRNIYAIFTLLQDRQQLPVFNGEKSFVTRCQYHVENPTFHDEIKISLPLDLKKDAQLHVSFMHASVKPKAKEPSQAVAFVSIPLFNNGCFIADEEHHAYISYSLTDPVEQSENNQFTFSTILNSCIYSSNQQVTSIFEGNLNIKSPPKINDLIPHLYFVLDSLFAAIIENKPEAFDSLLQILTLFQRERNHNDSQFLLFYLKFCAIRRENEKTFHKNFVQEWLKIAKTDEFSQKRSDFYCCWFLLELLMKSLMLDKDGDIDFDAINNLIIHLTNALPEFRVSGQSIGSTINRHLAFFYKDLFEYGDHKHAIDMIKYHLKSFELAPPSNLYDRNCFRDFIHCLISPKVFLFLLAPRPNGKPLFTELFIHHFESGIHIYEHTNEVFKEIFNLLVQFEPQEHEFIAQSLIPLIEVFGRSESIFEGYPNRMFLSCILIVGHYIFYYAKFDELTPEICRGARVLLAFSRPLTGAEKTSITEDNKKMNVSSENMTKTIMTSYQGLTDVPPILMEGKTQTQRKFASLKKGSKAALFKQNESNVPSVTSLFNGIAFGIQSILIYHAMNKKYHSIDLLNNIISKILDIHLSPILTEHYYSALESFIKEDDIMFCNPNSNLKHIIIKMIEEMTPRSLSIVKLIKDTEISMKGTSNRTDALICRAVYKTELIEGNPKIKSALGTPFEELITDIAHINRLLNETEIEKHNPDVFSDLIFQKSNLIAASPDARVESLLQLTQYHTETKYFSEAVISQLTAAALVAEYLDALGRLPKVFKCINCAQLFNPACPSANSEICPDKIKKDLPKLRGYCTSKHFTEYGLIYLIMTAMEMCKRANLFELLTKMLTLLSPLCEYRELWDVMTKQYKSGSFAWRVIGSSTTTQDRNLGIYYRVQFQNGKNYIYRESELANVWQVSERLKKSTELISNGKPVVVINEGEELTEEQLNDEKSYFVHLKSVLQYFTPKEKKKRVTVFEQNHNVSRFYFDLPFSKSAQSSIENCWLKRSIFTLPHPMPYLVKRVEIPKENIEKITFSPIELSCQNLQGQVDKIEEAMARKEFTALQPLLQGSLLVQVNEGPTKVAEVFLTGEYNEHQDELRKIFRAFLKSNAKGVLMHADYAKTNPVFAVLQEEMELGLNRLTSTLQPMLK